MHMSSFKTDFVDVMPHKGFVSVAGGHRYTVENIGTVELKMLLPNGSVKPAVLTKALYIPAMKNTRLFSWKEAAKHGHHLYGHGDNVFCLLKGKAKLWAKITSAGILIQTQDTASSKIFRVYTPNKRSIKEARDISFAPWTSPAPPASGGAQIERSGKSSAQESLPPHLPTPESTPDPNDSSVDQQISRDHQSFPNQDDYDEDTIVLTPAITNVPAKDNPPRKSLRVKENAEKSGSATYADHFDHPCDEGSIYYAFNISEAVDTPLTL